MRSRRRRRFPHAAAKKGDEPFMAAQRHAAAGRNFRPAAPKSSSPATPASPSCLGGRAARCASVLRGGRPLNGRNAIWEQACSLQYFRAIKRHPTADDPGARQNPDRGVSTSRRYQIPENLPSYPTTQRAVRPRSARKARAIAPVQVSTARRCVILPQSTPRPNRQESTPEPDDLLVPHDWRADSNPSFDRRGLSLSMQHWTAARRLAKCTRLSTRTGNTPDLWPT